MYAFLLSTAVIFVAELGDKSQLMALTFATRYRARDVIIGITAATAVVHLASVGIGAAVGEGFAEQQGLISVIAGVAFIVFAAWTLRGDELTDDEADKVKEIYANLGTRLSSRSEKEEVTAAFAGGAIFLLIAAGALSLRWFGRLI